MRKHTTHLTFIKFHTKWSWPVFDKYILIKTIKQHLAAKTLYLLLGVWTLFILMLSSLNSSQFSLFDVETEEMAGISSSLEYNPVTKITWELVNFDTKPEAASHSFWAAGRLVLFEGWGETLFLCQTLEIDLIGDELSHCDVGLRDSGAILD